jgi:hypothetical protein
MNKLEELHLNNIEESKYVLDKCEIEEGIGWAVSKEETATKSAEITEQIAIEFAEWLTREDSPYAVLYGGSPERWGGESEDFTTKQLFQEFLKQRQ